MGNEAYKFFQHRKAISITLVFRPGPTNAWSGRGLRTGFVRNILIRNARSTGPVA